MERRNHAYFTDEITETLPTDRIEVSRVLHGARNVRRILAEEE